ncbi:hypothetical protein LCGC14_0771620 [marine sediment metagenome]|uniref:Uncharacterized protein n=1 Tax=marine sediment metagenome TaxID=412755 RepID=A0A0F9Q2A9_9ZZZZ
MPDVEVVTYDVSNSVSDALSALIDAEALVIEQLNTELTFFIKTIALTVTGTIVDMLDQIFDLYPSEWLIVTDAMVELSNWMNSFAYGQARNIADIIQSFTTVANTLMAQVAGKLDAIDALIGPKYEMRMFAIYDRIAVFSKAINAPPFYLEGVIQNARTFVMTVTCLSGPDYYQFLSTWDSGVEQLLSRISRYTTLYRENPQWIKTDVEAMLIKPAYNAMRQLKQDESTTISDFNNRIGELIKSTGDLQLLIGENKYLIDHIFADKINPRLLEITESIKDWQANIYRNEMGVMQAAVKSTHLLVTKAGFKIADIFGLLDYGGDLLLRINSLNDFIRQDQEDKIADVANRSFARIVPDWLSIVKETAG